jgi:hypothetical protein
MSLWGSCSTARTISLGRFVPYHDSPQMNYAAARMCGESWAAEVSHRWLCVRHRERLDGDEGLPSCLPWCGEEAGGQSGAAAFLEPYLRCQAWSAHVKVIPRLDDEEEEIEVEIRCSLFVR